MQKKVAVILSIFVLIFSACAEVCLGPTKYPTEFSSSDVTRLKKEAEESRQRSKQRKIEYIKSHPDRNPQILDAIMEEKPKFVIGMTQEEVILVFHEPSEVNKTITSSGVHEQWILYHPARVLGMNERAKDCYLYFDNGILTGIQNPLQF